MYIICHSFNISAGNNPPRFEDLDIVGYRSVDSLGFIQEDIQSGLQNVTGNCMRAIRIEGGYNITIRASLIANLQSPSLIYCGVGSTRN